MTDVKPSNYFQDNYYYTQTKEKGIFFKCWYLNDFSWSFYQSKKEEFIQNGMIKIYLCDTINCSQVFILVNKFSQYWEGIIKELDVMGAEADADDDIESGEKEK